MLAELPELSAWSRAEQMLPAQAALLLPLHVSVQLNGLWLPQPMPLKLALQQV